MAQLEIRNVTRRFGDLLALDDVCLKIETGEFFTLLGPSGCGKTTLLRMIAGFDAPDSGQILLDGKDLADTPPEKRPVHTVFQSYALFPHMTVAENITFALRMGHFTQSEISARLHASIEQMRLTGKTCKYPHELSGGEKQRVALARSLIKRPGLLLLDESLAALDARLREEVQVELINLQSELGITFVFVTHAQTEALALSHRIAVMNQGRLEQVDEPSKLYGFPRNRFVAGFVGHINQLGAQVLESTPGRLRLSVPGMGDIVAPAQASSLTGQAGIFSIRPEQVRIGIHDELAGLKNHFSGKIQSVLYQGDVSVYRTKLADGVIIEALLPNSAPGRARLFEIDDTVKIGWRHDAGIFFHD
ncbi:MAG: ABC transporter ATP-binding protein [Gallionella sp.]|nr:ABC transporter ATP-binding protein [Gallionella sp.]